MLPVGRKIAPLKIIAVILVFTLSFFTGKFAADWKTGGAPQGTGDVALADGSELPVNRLNVLLLGIDARPGEKDARTDSMILVSIDRETRKIAVVSIPRDSMVEIEGHGTNKINVANVYGGPDLARQTVEKLLGVQIPYYVKTNFNGFKDIIDVLGGVDIDVEKRMYYPSEDINLKPGAQRLNGFDALGYVRFRHDALGDIGRTERQQKFLKALANEMFKPGTIIKAPVLVPKLMAAVDTNLGAGDAILAAKAVASLDSNNVTTATLPGVFYNYKGVSYWKVDQDKAQIVLQDLFAGVRVATITGPDENVPADRPAKSTNKYQSGSTDANKKPADTNVDNNGQTQGQTGDSGNTGQQPNQQGNIPGGTGQNTGQGQGGQYPGDQGALYPGQDQNGQYPGQNQGGQTPGQNANGQVIVDGKNNTGPNSGTMNPLTKPKVPAPAPVQPPTADSNPAQTGTSQPGGTTSSTNVNEG